ncbi:SBBP repeat-containing protein, partial [Candidatus Gottesmanbacteria bacterium]|nr:SBBP repeat-containing protein [Candidatus Gottesmanbacteria bacterium]
YDSSGNQLWVARYNGGIEDDEDYANAIAVDSAGNVYVTGGSSVDGGIEDYATVAYDSSGNQLWVARYNGPANGLDYGIAITVDTGGNVYVTGTSRSNEGYLDYATIKYSTESADACPDDPDKTEPGQCGCGVADTDSDGDGTADCNDLCPLDPAKIAPGQCGCGVADTDSDGDGVADCNDLCPLDPAKIAPGQCGCGVADTDSDGDGTADCNDLCPNDPAKTAPGICGCGVADTDSDGDGTADCNDSDDDNDGLTDAVEAALNEAGVTVRKLDSAGNLTEAFSISSSSLEADGSIIINLSNGWKIKLPPGATVSGGTLDIYVGGTAPMSLRVDGVDTFLPGTDPGKEFTISGVTKAYLCVIDDSSNICATKGGQVVEGSGCTTADTVRVDGSCDPGSRLCRPPGFSTGVDFTSRFECNISYGNNNGIKDAGDVTYTVEKIAPGTFRIDGLRNSFVVEYDDNDGDGFPPSIDCDDNNAAIHPGAQEVCDGVDNDCNSLTDENNVCGFPVTIDVGTYPWHYILRGPEHLSPIPQRILSGTTTQLGTPGTYSLGIGGSWVNFTIGTDGSIIITRKDGTIVVEQIDNTLRFDSSGTTTLDMGTYPAQYALLLGFNDRQDTAGTQTISNLLKGGIYRMIFANTTLNWRITPDGNAEIINQNPFTLDVAVLGSTLYFNSSGSIEVDIG